MSYNATVLRVLLASPNDAASENDIFKEVIYEWNAAYSEKQGVVLLPMSYKESEENLLEKCDILAAAFWTRLSPYIGKNLGDTLDSIDEHIDNGKTAVLFFSSQPVADGSVDSKQYKAYKKFRDALKTDGLHEAYDNLEELRVKFFGRLERSINDNKKLKKENLKTEVKETPVPKKEYAETAAPKKEVKVTEIPKTEIKSDVKQKPAETKAQTVMHSMEDEIFILESYMEEKIEPVKLNVKMPTISENASILLKETSLDANNTILRKSSINGTIIRTNKKNFVINNDKIDIVRWEAAIRELEHKGLIEDKNVSGEKYRLTDEGERVAELIED